MHQSLTSRMLTRAPRCDAAHLGTCFAVPALHAPRVQGVCRHHRLQQAEQSQSLSSAMVRELSLELRVQALMAAAGRGRADVVDMLLALGADSSVASHQGLKAADWATRMGHADIAATLQQHASDAEAAAAARSAAEALAGYHASNDADRVDLSLIQELLAYICGEGRFAGQARDVPARLWGSL